MGQEGDLDHGIAINTSRGFRESTDVNTHLAELRSSIQSRFRTSFESLPELTSTQFPVDKYLKENPQSIIFVPQKDMNMFLVIVQEAKAFAQRFKTEKNLDQMREHEFEHVQKAYELGIDVKGIGLFMFKHEGKPTFGGFVMGNEDQIIDLKDRLRILLAPRTMTLQSTDDKIEGGKMILRALTNSKSPQEFDRVMSDTLFVISERYLPKKVHSFFQKVFD